MGDGCLVAQVVPHGPASKAGLTATEQTADGSLVLGDLIVAVDGEPVRQSEDLIAAVEEKRDKDVVRLTVRPRCDPRKETIVEVTLTTRDRLRQAAAVGR